MTFSELLLTVKNSAVTILLVGLVAILMYGAYWYGGLTKTEGWDQFYQAQDQLVKVSKEAAAYRLQVIKAESLLAVKDSAVTRFHQLSLKYANEAQRLHDSNEVLLIELERLSHPADAAGIDSIPIDTMLPVIDSVVCAGWRNIALRFREEAGRWKLSYVSSDSSLQIALFQRDSTRVLLNGALIRIDTLNTTIDVLHHTPTPGACKILFFRCPTRTTSFIGGAIITTLGVIALRII